MIDGNPTEDGKQRRGKEEIHPIFFHILRVKTADNVLHCISTRSRDG